MFGGFLTRQVLLQEPAMTMFDILCGHSVHFVLNRTKSDAHDALPVYW
jgi:hypothetical protein